MVWWCPATLPPCEHVVEGVGMGTLGLFGKMTNIRVGERVKKMESQSNKHKHTQDLERFEPTERNTLQRPLWLYCLRA
jgi:hypothetical protein